MIQGRKLFGLLQNSVSAVISSLIISFTFCILLTFHVEQSFDVIGFAEN